MPDLEEMGAEGSPAMTSHAGTETTFADGQVVVEEPPE